MASSSSTTTASATAATAATAATGGDVIVDNNVDNVCDVLNVTSITTTTVESTTTYEISEEEDFVSILLRQQQVTLLNDELLPLLSYIDTIGVHEAINRNPKNTISDKALIEKKEDKGIEQHPGNRLESNDSGDTNDDQKKVLVADEKTITIDHVKIVKRRNVLRELTQVMDHATQLIQEITTHQQQRQGRQDSVSLPTSIDFLHGMLLLMIHVATFIDIIDHIHPHVLTVVFQRSLDECDIFLNVTISTVSVLLDQLLLRAACNRSSTDKQYHRFKTSLISSFSILLKSRNLLFNTICFRLSTWLSAQRYQYIPFTLIVPPDLSLQSMYSTALELQRQQHGKRKRFEDPPCIIRSMPLNQLYTDIQRIVMEEFRSHGGKLRVYGSCVNGFGSFQSDVDSCLDFDEEGALELLTNNSKSGIIHLLTRINEVIRKRLKMSNELRLVRSFVVSNARVPILRINKGDALEMSIAVSNYFPLLNSRLLYCYCELLRDCGGVVMDTWNPSLNPLVLFVTTIKEWAKARNVADASKGQLSSYSWTMLAIAYLIEARWLPSLSASWQQESSVMRICRSNGEEDQDNDDNKMSFFDWMREGIPRETVMGASRLQAWRDLYSQIDGLKRMLTGFFEYYGYSFDFYRDAIDIRGKGATSVHHDEKATCNNSEVRVDGGRIRKSDIAFDMSITPSSQLNNSERHLSQYWLWIVDPFEVNRVIAPKTVFMEPFIRELRRGYILSTIRRGSSLVNDSREISMWLSSLKSNEPLSNEDVDMLLNMKDDIKERSLHELKTQILEDAVGL